MVYDPSDEVIYGIASLSEVDKLTHNIVMIDAHTGKVISAFEVSDGLGEIVNVKGEFFLFGFDGSFFRQLGVTLGVTGTNFIEQFAK